MAGPPGRADRRHPRGLPDQRNAFQQDRDRILYSTALRRLAGITQVVGAAEGHIFHNRLTHTIEVAQLARRVAEKLLEGQPELAEASGGIDPEVAEAAAFAHDLGHPPFGHIAEQELDKLVTDDLKIGDGFEGNAQTFRVVTKLSVRYIDYPGQNLTRATLNAILKYPWTRGAEGYKRKKYGAYSSEGEDFSFAREIQPAAAPNEKSVEAEIMDWADDIVYAVHDMEDFYRAGFIPLDRLMDEDTGELTTFIEGTFRRWAMDFRPVRDHTDEELRQAILDLFEQLRETQQIREPYRGSLEQRANLRGFTSLLIGRYVDAISLKESDGGDPRTVAILPEAERQITMLKQLTWFYVIQGPSLAGQQHGQRKVIKDLFDIFFSSTESPKGRDVLPVGARERLERWLAKPDGQSVIAIRARIAADVVCTLNEQQAIALHQRLTGIDPGSVLYTMVP